MPSNERHTSSWRHKPAVRGGAELARSELVALKPDIPVINSTASVIAARRTAGTIPIVMAAVADPVAQGFVQSLERPGGSITDFAVEEPEMGAKWVELLKEIAPKVRHITVTSKNLPTMA